MATNFFSNLIDSAEVSCKTASSYIKNDDVRNFTNCVIDANVDFAHGTLNFIDSIATSVKSSPYFDYFEKTSKKK